jgi:hypothetical protein
MPEHNPIDLSRIADGDPLRALASGLIIVRRRKHEWVPGLAESKLERLRYETGKVRGSKFLPTWGLDRLVNWITQEITKANWRRQSNAFVPLEIVFPESVGLVSGDKVRTIRIVCDDGHYVHAYPVKDQP